MKLQGAVALTILLAVTSHAAAIQRLIRPGEDWTKVASTLRPGDEMILMPGRHVGGTVRGLEGTGRQPIVIRGLDAQHPAEIDADRYGIRLVDARHVVVRDLVISGARVHGISIEPSGDEAIGPITISGVSVQRTGPRGMRHGVIARGVKGLRIENVAVEGWAGSGLEIVSSRDVTILDSHLRGIEGFEQITGIRVRGGSEQVTIRGCRVEEPGDQGIALGGASRPDDFLPPPAEDVPTSSLAEARRVNVSACTIVGGKCGVAYVSADRCVVRQNTIHRPTLAVVSLRREHEDPRFLDVAHCSFGANLILWQPGELESLAHTAGDVDRSGLALEENLWWAGDLAATKADLGPFPGLEQFPQITDVDPRVDDDLRPRAAAAETFGVPE